MSDTVFTIGHSTYPIEKFLGLLKSASITVVGDVRSRPYSRMNPQYNQRPLRDALVASRIRYVYLGAELGARSEDPSCYRNGQVQYDLLAQTSLFRRGIERVREGASKHRIALMCAEKEPLECHRTILVARSLVEENIVVRHILADGSIETHEHAIERLIAKLRVPEGDLFRTQEMAVDEAYARQGKRIGFREEISDESQVGVEPEDKSYGTAQ